MQSIEIEDDFNFTKASSLRGRRSSSFVFAPSLLVGGLSRKSFSYDKLPQHCICLSILKLDGSCFDVEVPATATVAELKQAVESVFSHFPQKGPGKISWSHLWSQFCFCFEGQKLLIDNDFLRSYGIKDGDQLHFVRHVSIKYNMIKRKSKKRSVSRKLQDKQDEVEETDLILDDDNVFEDLENQRPHYFEEDEELLRKHRFTLARFFKGWFPYTKIPTEKEKLQERSNSSRLANGFVTGLQKLVRAYSERCCT